VVADVEPDEEDRGDDHVEVLVGEPAELGGRVEVEVDEGHLEVVRLGGVAVGRVEHRRLHAEVVEEPLLRAQREGLQQQPQQGPRWKRVAEVAEEEVAAGEQWRRRGCGGRDGGG
jgi:hypothetical protein